MRRGGRSAWHLSGDGVRVVEVKVNVETKMEMEVEEKSLRGLTLSRHGRML